MAVFHTVGVNVDGKPRRIPSLQLVRLGNKTYEHYNTVARTVDRRLQELGATRVGARGEGDDDGNLEEDFLAWKEDMWKAVCGHYGIDPATVKLELYVWLRVCTV